MATFDNLKTDLKVAAKPLYAGVGATDLAVELVRDYVTEAQKRFADAQKRVTDLDLEPTALRDQATTVVTARVDALEGEGGRVATSRRPTPGPSRSRPSCRRSSTRTSPPSAAPTTT